MKPGPKPIDQAILRARGSWRGYRQQTAAKVVPLTTSEPPRKPLKHLGRDGKAFWRKVADAYELSDSQYAILRQACEALDRAEKCREQIDREGQILYGPRGGMMAHPLLRSENAARSAFIRCYRTLEIDTE